MKSQCYPSGKLLKIYTSHLHPISSVCYLLIVAWCILSLSTKTELNKNPFGFNLTFICYWLSSFFYKVASTWGPAWNSENQRLFGDHTLKVQPNDFEMNSWETEFIPKLVTASAFYDWLTAHSQCAGSWKLWFVKRCSDAALTQLCSSTWDGELRGTVLRVVLAPPSYGIHVTFLLTAALLDIVGS